MANKDMAQQIENSTIGIDLLKMLMLQLYSNPRCIYREYIQNALDSINDAVRLGILTKVKDGHVNINISSNNITIEDNGTGIKADCAVKYLTDIANSIKNGVIHAGLYGVGRLSGGGYCDILEFDTSYQGEGVGTVVSIDTRILRRLLDENKNEMSAEDAMCRICTTQTYEVDNDKHYFIVRLRNITNSASILLDQSDILQYIKEVAPIDYSATFNSLINLSDQNEFVERHKSVSKIRVSLNEIADIEKSYDLVVKGNDDNIEKLRYFELPVHEKYGSMGWGWYAVTDFSGVINEEKDYNVGIRLRKHNISLDKNILNSCFKETRGNKYFYGEIFISNDKIVPDSGRQGLAASEEADALLKTIREYFCVLTQVYYKASRLKTKLKTVQEIVDSIKDKTDPAVISILIGKLKDSVSEFEKASIRDKNEEVNDVITIYREKYNHNLKQIVDELIGNISIEEENGSNENDTLTVNDSRSTEGDTIQERPLQPNNTNSTRSSVDSNNDLDNDKNASFPQHTQEGLGSKEQSHIVGTLTTQPSSDNLNQKKKDKGGVDEILQPLINKKLYTPEQLAVLRKVLNTMLMVCPSSKKRNLSVLMHSAIASLE